MRTIDGQTVGNAAKSIRITITPDDIKKGKPMEPNACAIARAVLREVPGATDVMAHLDCVYIRCAKEWLRYKTPEYAKREITAFDRGGWFAPGEVELKAVPTAALVRRVKQIRNGASGGTRRGPKRPTPHYTVGVRESARKNIPAPPPNSKRRARKQPTTKES
jgi:hypothetical protein